MDYAIISRGKSSISSGGIIQDHRKSLFIGVWIYRQRSWMNIKAEKVRIYVFVLLLCAICSDTAAGREQNEKARYGLKSEDYALPPNATELVFSGSVRKTA
jgi:hypothetical protein